MHHQCTLGVEVLQYHMWAIGEIDSLLSVKVSIELRIKISKRKITRKSKKEMLEMIDDGKIKIELNNEKQERHILNTKAYYNKKYNSSILPSYITLDTKEIEKITKKNLLIFLFYLMMREI